MPLKNGDFVGIDPKRKVLYRNFHDISGTVYLVEISRNALKVHIKALHTLERPFKCEVPDCGMTYMTRLDLDRHSKKHAKALERQEKQKEWCRT